MTTKKDLKLMRFMIFAILFFTILPLQAQDVPPELAGLMPPKALVYLESADLGGQLDQLLKSGFSEKFVKTQVYKDFTISKLFNKLSDRIASVEEATEFGINIKNITALAGSKSALALYDIGELKFVFITRTGEEKVIASSLWSLRDKFETRKAVSLGKEYWVKEENGGRVTFAFTFHNGYLLAGTDIVNFEKTLELMAGKGEKLSDSAPFTTAVKPVLETEDILLYLNQEMISQTPYWRNYWLYQNQNDLANISFAAITLKVAQGELREKRYFTLKEAAPGKNAAFSDLVKALPAGMDYYQYGPLSSGETVNQLGTIYTGVESKEITSLVNVLLPAKPVRFASATALNQGPDFDSLRLSKVLVFELESPGGFVQAEFEKGLAGLFESKLLYGEEGIFKFIQKGEFRVIEIPLIKNIKVAYRLNGNKLIMLQGLENIPASSGDNPLVAASEGTEKLAGFWLDYQGGSGKLVNYFDFLAKRNNWGSTNNAKFFDVSYSSFLELLQGIKTINKTAAVDGNLLTEEVRYQLAP